MHDKPLNKRILNIALSITPMTDKGKISQLSFKKPHFPTLKITKLYGPTRYFT